LRLEFVKVGSGMPDETKPMTDLALPINDAATKGDRQKADLLQGWLTPQPQRVGMVAWLQRGLLALLLLAHCVYPIWLGRVSDLLTDSLILAQATVLLVLLTHGGLGLWATLSILLLATVPAAGWYYLFATHAPYLLTYVGSWLLPYTVCCTLTLFTLRFYGFQGTWQDPVYDSKPLQISIRSLLVVMTVVAVVLTASSVLRRNEIVGDRDWWLWINVVTDGVVVSGLTALVVLCIGRPGSPVLRGIILVSALLFLGGCNIYAFRMEDFWQLPALTMLAWSGMTVGTLMIFRICGWRVVLPWRDGAVSQGKG
jgi:hypothetical protein